MKHVERMRAQAEPQGSNPGQPTSVKRELTPQPRPKRGCPSAAPPGAVRRRMAAGLRFRTSGYVRIFDAMCARHPPALTGTRADRGVVREATTSLICEYELRVVISICQEGLYEARLPAGYSTADETVRLEPA